MATEDSPVTRRSLLTKGLAAGAAASIASEAVAQTAPATQPEGLGDDFAAAVRLSGREFSETDLDLIRQSMRRTRVLVGMLRNRELPPSMESAITFDPWLDVDPPAADGVSAPTPTGTSDVDPNDETALAFAPVRELAKLLRSGKVTSVQLTKLALKRLEKHGPDLNCVVNLTADLAMRQAEQADADLAAGNDRGPLHGIPYGAKDLLATKDTPTTFGVSVYADQIFDEDATVIQRLEAAGAVLVAKLSLGELAMGDVWFGGTTRNPWNPEQGSSGSSAGSCSAVAAGLVPFAIGSETLGSIVSPSVRCGTCGLRPTFGRVPRTGAMPLSRTMDKLGPIARAADDLAYVLAAIAGTDGEDLTVRDATFTFPLPEDRPLRVGYDKVAFDNASDGEGGKVYAEALERCRELFGELVEVALPADSFAYPTAMLTVNVESGESFTELMDSGRLGELVQQEANSWPNIFRSASLISAADYLRAQRVRRELMGKMAKSMKDGGGVDVMITIPLAGEQLAVTNLTGQPTCLVRAGMADGLPRQLEFVGTLYGEDAILTAASRFEAETPASTEWPRERWS